MRTHLIGRMGVPTRTLPRKFPSLSMEWKRKLTTSTSWGYQRCRKNTGPGGQMRSKQNGEVVAMLKGDIEVRCAAGRFWTSRMEVG